MRETGQTVCGCGAPVPDGFLCSACTRSLRDALTELAPGSSWLPSHADGLAGRQVSTRWDLPAAVVVGGLAEHLSTTAARQARIGDAFSSGEKPVPFHEKGADLRSRLVRTLAPWAGWLLQMERPPVAPPPCRHRDPVGVDCHRCAVEVPAEHALRRARWVRRRAAVDAGDLALMAAYLLQRVNVISGQEQAVGLRADVVEAVQLAEQLIDRPAELVATGDCGADRPDGSVCRRPLYADPAQPFVTCPQCGTRWSVVDRREWLLKAAEDSLGTAATIATALTRLEQPLTADRIYKWKERGKLLPHSHEAPPPCRDHQGIGRQPVSCEACAERQGAPLYRLGDVVDLLAAGLARKAARVAS